MSSNSRIAKNTLFLYVRMIFTLIVSLYTSRLILSVLGVEDFGIYNITASIIVFFSFFNVAMTGATQRFLNFEMGKGNTEGVHKVFCISVNIYFVLALIILLLAETIGLWVVNNVLNIPSTRMLAANCVYQFSIFTFIIGIFKIPYNATILAYEKMSFYAVMSLVEVSLKLVSVACLIFINGDKLMSYSVFIFLTSVLILIFHVMYSNKNFETCKYNFVRDAKLTKELVSFSSWNIFGNIALIGSNQGIAIILNIFSGVGANAALGVANQVNTAIYGFVSSLQTAFNPQIIKSYAAGNYDRHKQLLFQASRFSYYLFLLLAIPLLFCTDQILLLWLGNVPEYSVQFTQLVIIISLIEAISGPLWVSIYAYGKLRYYQLLTSFILFLIVPFAYIFIKLGGAAEYVFIAKLVATSILYIYRLYFIKRYLSITVKELFFDVFGRVLCVSTLSILMAIILKHVILKNSMHVLNIFIFSILSVIITTLFVFLLGITSSEKRYLYEILNKKIKNVK